MKAASVVLAMFCLLPASAALAGDPVRGAQLYESRCIACHSLDANRIGPMHRGVFGRTAGSVADYAYSEALTKSKVVWGTESLGRWLQNPQAFIPGQKMGFRVPIADDRADIVAYLRQVSD